MQCLTAEQLQACTELLNRFTDAPHLHYLNDVNESVRLLLFPVQLPLPPQGQGNIDLEVPSAPRL